MGRKNRVRKQRREQAKAKRKEFQELKEQLLEQSIHIIFTNSPLFLERLQQKIVYWSRTKGSAFYELGAAGELDRLQKLKKFVQDSLAILNQGLVVSLEEERDGKTVTHNLMFEWLLIVQAIVKDLDDDSFGRNSVMDCPKVKIAGESLNALGGKDFMYSMYKLFPKHLSRPLDVAWHGIGDWKAEAGYKSAGDTVKLGTGNEYNYKFDDGLYDGDNVFRFKNRGAYTMESTSYVNNVTYNSKNGSGDVNRYDYYTEIIGTSGDDTIYGLEKNKVNHKDNNSH